MISNSNHPATWTTSERRPVTWWVQEQVEQGNWTEQVILPELTGLTRAITVFRAQKKSNLIAYDWHGDKQTFCPPMWWDLAIGSGACNLGCRACIEETTWIYTDIGPIQAKDLSSRFDERSWLVLGYTNDFQAVWTPLLAIASKPSPNELLGFKLDTGHQVQVTPDHPMIVARPGTFAGWDGSLGAETIVVNDWLPIVQQAPHLQENIKFLDLLSIAWNTPIKVEDSTLASRLPSTTLAIATGLGQQRRSAKDRNYPFTGHALRGEYDLHEYREVLHTTGLEPDDQLRVRAAYGQSSLPRYMALDRNFGFILGHYLAEGSKTDREICVDIHQRELDTALSRWKLLSDAPIAVSYRSENGASLKIAHTTLAKLFDILVPGNAFTKRLPACVWQGPQEFAEGILEGLFFGDGHLDQSGGLIYATCSEGMAADTRQLLWQIGYSPTIVRNHYREGKLAFQVRLQKRQAISLIHQLHLPWATKDRDRDMVTQRYPYALLMQRKGQIWGNVNSTRWSQRVDPKNIDLSDWGKKIVEGNLGLARVSEITPIQSPDTRVYDLQTGTGNFVAGDGILVHNCFLVLTHRIRRDPWRHLLYSNTNDFLHAAEKWLRDPIRRRQHTLGVGIDRSDSLLYEGVTGHVRSLAPLFASSQHNPTGNKLILLTKSANTRYLEEIAPEHRARIVVSFSLNPQSIADCWEGLWPDGERIPPTITQRLDAALHAQDLGFEVRVRIDPIMTPNDWQESYEEFFAEIARRGIQFAYYTLGTYREKNQQLQAWIQHWGMTPMTWQPNDGDMTQDGTHRHLSEPKRVEIYQIVRDSIRRSHPMAKISLCKETHTVRKLVGLCNADCNCLT